MGEIELNKIKITVDSPADLPDSLIKTYDIKITPLYINTPSGSHKDMVDITPIDIFNQYEKTKLQ